MSKQKRVHLFSESTENFSQDWEAYIDEKGKLHIEGYWTGSDVEDRWSDSDQEFFIEVKETDFPDDILDQLKAAGKGWRSVLEEAGLTWTQSIW